MIIHLILMNKISGGEIKKAMNALPDGYRSVMSLYLFEGYDHQEIGEILQISEKHLSPNTVGPK